MKVKTVYYDDLLNDEFSGTKIRRIPLPKKFKFVHKNPFWKACAWFVYYGLAVPILWFVGKIGWGVKVYGRKNLKLLASSRRLSCMATTPRSSMAGAGSALVLARKADLRGRQYGFPLDQRTAEFHHDARLLADPGPRANTSMLLKRSGQNPLCSAKSRAS
jgi:hypothetical protein